MKKYIIFILIIFISNSCKSSEKYIDIYFINGNLNTNIPLTKDDVLSMNNKSNEYSKTISKEDYDFIISELNSLKKFNYLSKNNCDIRMVIIYESDTLSIGNSNCFIYNSYRVNYPINKQMEYKLKSLTGYYNFFSKSELENIEEIQRFGIPELDSFFVKKNKIIDEDNDIYLREITTHLKLEK